MDRDRNDYMGPLVLQTCLVEPNWIASEGGGVEPVGCQPIDITGISRRMRGGSQAHLVMGSDGQFYVAKFAGNPQGKRILVNEWIGFHLLRMVSVATPPLALVRLSQELIDKQSPHFDIGPQRVPVRAGVHLGSQCPVNPNTTAIFDFLPRKLLPQVVNIEDFAKVFVIDKLLGQVDTRQAVFVRERGGGNGRIAFRAYMIDQGGLFGQTKWMFENAPLHGLANDEHIYSFIDMRRLCLETIELLRNVNEKKLHAWMRNIPREWFAAGDHDRLASLFSEVVCRIAKIDSIIGWQLDELAKRCRCLWPTPARARELFVLRNPQEPSCESAALI